jgi:hypothetical protein
MGQKIILFTAIALLLWFKPSFAAVVDASGGVVSPVTQTASPTPSPEATPHYTQAIGIDVGLAGVAIPGISYMRMITKNTRASIFLGGLYTKDGIAALSEINVFYDLNQYFYAGIGVNALYDYDGTLTMGFFNPTIGLKSDIISDYKLFIEATLVFFSYQSQVDVDDGMVLSAPTLLYKMGVRYYF